MTAALYFRVSTFFYTYLIATLCVIIKHLHLLYLKYICVDVSLNNLKVHTSTQEHRKKSEGTRKLEPVYFNKLPRGGGFNKREAVAEVQWSWTHLGLVDDQTHECGHQHGPGQRRRLALQLGFVHGESGRFVRHCHRVGVSQRRHGSAAECCPTPGCQPVQLDTVKSLWHTL